MLARGRLCFPGICVLRKTMPNSQEICTGTLDSLGHSCHVGLRKQHMAYRPCSRGKGSTPVPSTRWRTVPLLRGEFPARTERRVVLLKTRRLLCLPWGQESRAHFSRPYKPGGGQRHRGRAPPCHAALGTPSNEQSRTSLDLQGPGEGPRPLLWLPAQPASAGGL